MYPSTRRETRQKHAIRTRTLPRTSIAVRSSTVPTGGGGSFGARSPTGRTGHSGPVCTHSSSNAFFASFVHSFSTARTYDRPVSSSSAHAVSAISLQTCCESFSSDPHTVELLGRANAGADRTRDPVTLKRAFCITDYVCCIDRARSRNST